MEKKQLQCFTPAWYQKLQRSMWHTPRMDKNSSYLTASKQNRNLKTCPFLNYMSTPLVFNIMHVCSKVFYCVDNKHT